MPATSQLSQAHGALCRDLIGLIGLFRTPSDMELGIEYSLLANHCDCEIGVLRFLGF